MVYFFHDRVVDPCILS